VSVDYFIKKIQLFDLRFICKGGVIFLVGLSKDDWYDEIVFELWYFGALE
jgi:hypothetical protein